MVSKKHAGVCCVTDCLVIIPSLNKNASFMKSNGFTLVELIVVVGIIGVLATTAIPAFSKYIKTTRNNTCIADIRTIDKAIGAYYIDKGVLPPTASFLSSIGMSNQLDPWKRSFAYLNLSDAGAVPLDDIAGNPLNTDYDLYSKGENNSSSAAAGDPNNADDIVRSNNGSFAGLRP